MILVKTKKIAKSSSNSGNDIYVERLKLKIRDLFDLEIN